MLRSRRWWLGAAGGLAAALAGWFRFKTADSAALPAPCREVEFADADFIVCELPREVYALELRLRDLAGRPFGSVKAATAGGATGKGIVLATNAGMYHKDLSPVGLHVQAGVELSPLNREEGEGNFFLKPNGVFFADDAGRAGVMETEAFAAAGLTPRFATQSGPMLVIDGEMHPRFQRDGTSRFIRNGVGVRADGAVMLAVSRDAVSLGVFARLFRDELECPNALFFDGAVSALFDGERYLVGGEQPAGPVLVVTSRKRASSSFLNADQSPSSLNFSTQLSGQIGS